MPQSVFNRYEKKYLMPERVYQELRGRLSPYMQVDSYGLHTIVHFDKVDYTEQKKLAAAVSRAATNINHICRRINSTGHFYADDIADLKERQAEIWSLLREVQKKEL